MWYDPLGNFIPKLVGPLLGPLELTNLVLELLNLKKSLFKFSVCINFHAHTCNEEFVNPLWDF